jgi:hypothetical protein
MVGRQADDTKYSFSMISQEERATGTPWIPVTFRVQEIVQYVQRAEKNGIHALLRKIRRNPFPSHTAVSSESDDGHDSEAAAVPSHVQDAKPLHLLSPGTAARSSDRSDLDTAIECVTSAVDKGDVKIEKQVVESETLLLSSRNVKAEVCASPKADAIVIDLSEQAATGASAVQGIPAPNEPKALGSERSSIKAQITAVEKGSAAESKQKSIKSFFSR